MRLKSVPQIAKKLKSGIISLFFSVKIMLKIVKILTIAI